MNSGRYFINQKEYNEVHDIFFDFSFVFSEYFSPDPLLCSITKAGRRNHNATPAPFISYRFLIGFEVI